MLRKFYRHKGQNVSAEYVLLIALVSIAIVGMTIYVRRAVQGRYRDANRAVYMKASTALGAAVQAEYEPYYVETQADVDVATVMEQSIIASGEMERKNTLDRSVSVQSTQKPF